MTGQGTQETVGYHFMAMRTENGTTQAVVGPKIEENTGRDCQDTA